MYCSLGLVIQLLMSFPPLQLRFGMRHAWEFAVVSIEARSPALSRVCERNGRDARMV